MGVNDRAFDKKQDQKNAAKDKRKWQGTQQRGNAVADWASVPGELLLNAVAALAASGGAMRLGYTRDGGAYAVGIYGDGEPFTEYRGPGEEIEQFLQEVIDTYGKA